MRFLRWGNPGVNRVGGLLEAEGLKRVESGIPKVGKNPGVKKVGSLLEAGELNRVGSGIPKVRGTQ